METVTVISVLLVTLMMMILVFYSFKNAAKLLEFKSVTNMKSWELLLWDDYIFLKHCDALEW